MRSAFTTRVQMKIEFLFLRIKNRTLIVCHCSVQSMAMVPKVGVGSPKAAHI